MPAPQAARPRERGRPRGAAGARRGLRGHGFQNRRESRRSLTQRATSLPPRFRGLRRVTPARAGEAAGGREPRGLGRWGVLCACAAPGVRRGRDSRAPWRRQAARQPWRGCWPWSPSGRPRGPEQVVWLGAYGVRALGRAHSTRELHCLNKNPECCLCCSGSWKVSKSSWGRLVQRPPGTPGSTRQSLEVTWGGVSSLHDTPTPI